MRHRCSLPCEDAEAPDNNHDDELFASTSATAESPDDGHDDELFAITGAATEAPVHGRA